MSGRHDRTVKERKAQHARVWKRAIAASVVFHVLVFFLWRYTPIPESPFAAAGPRAGDNLAAAGGGMQALNVRTPPPIPITPPLVPLPSVADLEPVDIEPDVRVDASALMGEGPGEIEGPGLVEGTGRGDGGTAEEGRFRVVPPTPRGMILPPTNSDLKGRQVEVWVFVNEQGRVVSDSTRLNPPTPDRSYNRRLIEEAAQWVFRPATQGGKAVASWFPYTISM
jgi:hypothetical protein